MDWGVYLSPSPTIALPEQEAALASTSDKANRLDSQTGRHQMILRLTRSVVGHPTTKQQSIKSPGVGDSFRMRQQSAIATHKKFLVQPYKAVASYCMTAGVCWKELAQGGARVLTI
jgi:hypothetical protein